MHIYSVLNKSTENTPIFIEEKFSFLALIFQVLWLIYHKIWQPTIIIIIIKLSIYFALSNGLINEYISYIVNFIIAITIAIFAKSWYINCLKNSGYTLNYVIAAENEDAAKMRFLKNKEN